MVFQRQFFAFAEGSFLVREKVAFRFKNKTSEKKIFRVWPLLKNERKQKNTGKEVLTPKLKKLEKFFHTKTRPHS